MLRFLSFSSGSCGNCYYLEHTDSDGTPHALLIDAGVSLRRLKQVLQANSLDENSFSSVLITHDHMDHIRSLASYCKRLKKPVYATSELHSALAAHSFGEPYLGQCRCELKQDAWNDIDGFRVKYFVVPHDATQTVGYYIAAGDRKFVIMTDLGRMTDEALKYAGEADTVVVEHGHLSNDECANAISKFYHPGLKNVFLCHLSEHNNTPELAYGSASAALKSAGAQDGTVLLRALPRQTPSGIIIL